MIIRVEELERGAACMVVDNIEDVNRYLGQVAMPQRRSTLGFLRKPVIRWTSSGL
jgi:hypothetical protein